MISVLPSHDYFGTISSSDAANDRPSRTKVLVTPRDEVGAKSKKGLLALEKLGILC